MSTLSTHVLDVVAGVPARGVAVALFHGEALVPHGALDDVEELRELVGVGRKPGPQPGAFLGWFFSQKMHHPGWSYLQTVRAMRLVLIQQSI